MSESFVTAGKRCCPKCKRTVVPVVVENGETVFVDSEVQKVVTYSRSRGGTGALTNARRLHAERCLDYQLENERKQLRERQRRQMRELTTAEQEASTPAPTPATVDEG